MRILRILQCCEGEKYGCRIYEVSEEIKGTKEANGRGKWGEGRDRSLSDPICKQKQRKINNSNE